MTSTIDIRSDADRALKARLRTMWALGDYPAVAHDVIPHLGETLVAAAGVGPGQRVLDVAAGPGNAAIPAALAGADVVASDLTPALLEAGRANAAAAGASLAWEEADAEDLPYADASFDTVLSCVGVMFAPHHQLSADEMVRVTRPGGTIALVSWTPAGYVGQMLKTVAPFAPPPPPGASPAPLWGDPEHLAGLLGDRVGDVRTERRSVRVDHFDSPSDFREYFKRNYGPTVAVYRSLADDPERSAALDAALDDLAASHGAPATREDGTVAHVMEWEYLLYLARRR